MFGLYLSQYDLQHLLESFSRRKKKMPLKFHLSVAAAVKGSWRYPGGLAGPQAKSQNHTRSVTRRPRFSAWLMGLAIMKLNTGLDLTLSRGAKLQCRVGNIPVALMGKLFLWSPRSGSEKLQVSNSMQDQHRETNNCLLSCSQASIIPGEDPHRQTNEIQSLLHLRYEAGSTTLDGP